jgi:hypothetical protein
MLYIAILRIQESEFRIQGKNIHSPLPVPSEFWLLAPGFENVTCG